MRFLPPDKARYLKHVSIHSDFYRFIPNGYDIHSCTRQADDRRVT